IDNWVSLSLLGPSPCEEERRAAMEALSVFVPSCESGGSFRSTQCQQGAQCWCVDPTGREVPGTRRLGDAALCSE
uniref:Thyroglobulin type-1 domain-containing protein n=1 Tax=Labrus bergylta TaxID=56723 RepID=A0A3Q3GJK9_9LABR